MTGAELDELVEFAWNETGVHREQARRVLTAVLPRVLEGVVEDLGPFVPTEGDDPDCGCKECSAIQRAEARLSRIDALLKGE